MNDELEFFLRDWRIELKEVNGELSPPVSIPSEEERSDLISATTVTVGNKRDDQELCLEDEQSLLRLQKRQHLDEKIKEGTDGLALFVLPGGGDLRTRSRQHEPRHRDVDEGIIRQNCRERRSLVDTLIADLVRREPSVRVLYVQGLSSMVWVQNHCLWIINSFFSVSRL